MTFRLVAAVVAFVGVPVFGCAGAVTGLQILEAVNSKLAATETFEPLGWHFSKTARLNREYRRLYPDGKLLRRQGVLSMAALTCLVLFAMLVEAPFLGIVWIGGGGALVIWFVYLRKWP